MWTSQVYGHHDKMARTRTHRTSQNMEYTKTQQTLRINYFLCFFGFFCCFLFSVFNYLKDLNQKKDKRDFFTHLEPRVVTHLMSDYKYTENITITLG